MSVNTDAAMKALITHMNCLLVKTGDRSVYHRPLDQKLTALIIDLCALAREEGCNYQDMLDNAEGQLEYGGKMTATLETAERNEAERCRYCGEVITQGEDSRWRAGGRAHCHFHPVTGRSLDHKPMEE